MEVILDLLSLLDEELNCENRYQTQEVYERSVIHFRGMVIYKYIFMQDFCLTREICRRLIDERASRNNQKT